jgi:TonB-linked SusC/RagA family outer membrane protein
MYGEPLPGVVISSEDKKALYTTDHNGNYNFPKKISDHTLTYTLIGYKEQKIAISKGTAMDVVLEEDGHATAERVNFGFTRQSRETLSNAVSTVSGETLGKSLMSRLQGTFTGRMSGLTSLEASFQPNYEDVTMIVRGYSTIHGGAAGIVIDGILYDSYSHDIIYRLTPQEIESVSVLKDGASQALYGMKGSNGLIVITTKRGTPGKIKINVSLDETLQEPSIKPTFINSATYAALRNQAAYNDGLGRNYYYTDDQISKFAVGDDPLYPNTDWYGMLFRKMSHQQRIGMDATGGSDVVQYYTNINMTRQGGFYHTDQEKYNVNNELYKANVRTNIDVKINQFLSGYMSMAGNIVRRHDPHARSGSGNASIYTLSYYMPPTLYGPTTPMVVDQDWKILDPGGEVTTTTNIGNSPYGMLNRSGYVKETNTNIYGQAGLTLDMSFLTPGLSAGVNIGYLAYTTAALQTTQNFARYTRDDDWSQLSFTQHGTAQNTELGYGKGSATYGYMSYKGEVNYVRDFGVHHINATRFILYQTFDDNTGNIASTYEFKRIYYGMEVQYDYDKRYALKYDLGISGSDYFPSGNRFLWTPGISAAWIASNESFVKEAVPWLTMAKPRLSLAITGNDALGLDRYGYLDQVSATGGGPLGYLGYVTTETAFGNANLKPETIKKYNVGLDLGFADQVSLSVDFFKEKMDDGVTRSTALIPSYQGISLGAFPAINFAKYENKGYEVELQYRRRFNKDWSLFAGGHVSYNKNKRIYIGETPNDEDYAYLYRNEGYMYGQSFGYLVDWSNGNGLYNFQEEIDAGPTYSFGTPRLGDIKYKDLNEDGTIDEKDHAPIGGGALPRYFYGISGGFTFRDFDLSFLLQGVGDYYQGFYGLIVNESVGDGRFSESHMNAWTEDRWLNNEKITYPALSASRSVSAQASDYWIRNCAFMRLKNLEIGYILPDKISGAIGMKSLKLTLGGQNLFTIDKGNAKDMPVEGSYGAFPIYRMYRIGIRAQF